MHPQPKGAHLQRPSHFLEAPSPTHTLRINTESMGSSEEDILFVAAADLLYNHAEHTLPLMENYIREILSEDKTSPLINFKQLSESVDSMSDPSQKGDPSNIALTYLQNVLIKASQKALSDQQKNIHQHKSDSSRNVTRRNIAIICGIISTLISTLSVKYTS
jgi:hypothetical protein